MRSRHGRYASPLRYPGGKATWAADLTPLVDGVEVFYEPFAGGLGAGLTLLRQDLIGELWFSEAHVGLAAMWQDIMRSPEGFAQRVAAFRPTMYRFTEAKHNLTIGKDLGFSTFIVNRCSRSGFVTPNASAIGGIKQTKHTVEARYNGEALAQRILDLAPLVSRMRFVGNDGVHGTFDIGSSGFADEVFVFADPPYWDVGNRLYAVGMTEEQHRHLALFLAHASFDWLATYDNSPIIRELYAEQHIVERVVHHRANHSHRDVELIITPR